MLIKGLKSDWVLYKTLYNRSLCYKSYFFNLESTNKITPTAAESQWIGGDNVRFRYGVPEKIGGWDQLGADKLTGAVRAVHHFLDSNGVKVAALGSKQNFYTYILVETY